jgi:organic radical activating enzyme
MAEEKRYRVNEIFYSLQGEGARAGSANVFVRFSGCNLKCDMEPGLLSPGGFACDTEFVSGVDYTLDELVRKISEADTGGCHWVIFTGGEPLLQLDADLIKALCLRDYRVAIETNGTRPIPKGLDHDIDYIAVSPKVAEHALKIERAEELRYVITADRGIPRPSIKADHYFLSPAFDQDGRVDRAALTRCIELCLIYPQWRLSLQLHKVIGVR